MHAPMGATARFHSEHSKVGLERCIGVQQRRCSRSEGAQQGQAPSYCNRERSAPRPVRHIKVPIKATTR